MQRWSLCRHPKGQRLLLSTSAQQAVLQTGESGQAKAAVTGWEGWALAAVSKQKRGSFISCSRTAGLCAARLSIAASHPFSSHANSWSHACAQQDSRSMHVLPETGKLLCLPAHLCRAYRAEGGDLLDCVAAWPHRNEVVGLDHGHCGRNDLRVTNRVHKGHWLVTAASWQPEGGMDAL